MKEIDKTLKIIEALRRGCPTDKKRDYSNVIRHLKEEILELEEAIKSNDAENLKEELGDVLFNALFLAKIAKEKNGVAIAEIAEKINEKMIFRHPHVFENPRKVSIDEADRIWEERKRLQNLKHSNTLL